MRRSEGTEEWGGESAAKEGLSVSEELRIRSASPSSHTIYACTAAGLLLSAFYAVWFLAGYDQPRWLLGGLSVGAAALLLAGLPLRRLQRSTAAHVMALSLATLLLLVFTSQLTVESNVHLCLLAVGFAQLALVPEHRHGVRAAFSGVVISLLIACEFLFPATQTSAAEATRLDLLSNVNRIWTVVIVVGAMAIIRYKNSHRQQDLSGAAELGEQRANTDAMTGINNRRPVLARLRELDAAGSHGYAVALIDIDSFKAINDEYGHEQGDALICAVAQRVRSHFRQTDLVSRWGGDEFLVLLPTVDASELSSVLERLRATVAQSPFAMGASRIEVTLSIGVAVAQPGMTTHLTMRDADQALYAAKSTGRNRVVQAHDAESSVTRSA